MIDRIDTPSCFEAKLEKEGKLASLICVERRATQLLPVQIASTVYLCGNKRAESPTPLASVDL
jgi:hypothetical protein